MRKLIDHSKRRCKICGDITHLKELTYISGPLICSEKTQKYSEIFSLVCPEHSFEDFFISTDNIGKSFDPQKLLDSGLMG